MQHPFVRAAIARVKLGRPKPLWFDVVTQQYPPIHHSLPRSQPSKAFKNFDSARRADSDAQGQSRDPQRTTRQIVYPEDAIRRAFYARYPMELTRPKSLDEAARPSRIEQAIQFQASLMEEGITTSEAEQLADAFYRHAMMTDEAEELIARKHAKELGLETSAHEPSSRQADYLALEIRSLDAMQRIREAKEAAKEKRKQDLELK